MAAKQRDNSRVPPQLREHAFKPGESGNPKGRPRGTSLRGILSEALAEVPEGEIHSVAERIVARVIEDAVRGNLGAMKLLWAYIEGLPKAALSLDVTDSTPGVRRVEDTDAELRLGFMQRAVERADEDVGEDAADDVWLEAAVRRLQDVSAEEWASSGPRYVTDRSYLGFVRAAKRAADAQAAKADNDD